jgi:hypothetical protein
MLSPQQCKYIYIIFILNSVYLTHLFEENATCINTPLFVMQCDSVCSVCV